MKKYALYPGCVMPTEQYAYEISLRNVFPILDIEFVDLQGFSCCGEPMKSVTTGENKIVKRDDLNLPNISKPVDPAKFQMLLSKIAIEKV
ncbi:unnamed protein product [marine sediment metagenome]|uniref:Cysteine-rich domain-containing protein n=1 Tax=marine sediment metagenome TaxID=412755 RepID=X1GII1_9ZZZZ